MTSRVRVIVAVAVASVLALLLYLGFQWWERKESQDVLITLHEMPEVSADTLAAQGALFRVEEPLLYNSKTKVGVFVVEVLSTKNFGNDTHYVFGGDTLCLRHFAEEIRFVNAGPSRFGSVASGVGGGVTSLVGGMWHLLWHPIDSVEGLASAIGGAGQYVWQKDLGDMGDDTANLVRAFYVNKACEVSEAHDLDYFDLKTDRGRETVHSEVNAQLGGRGAFEAALFLIPFTKAKYAEEAAQTGRLAEASVATQKAVELAEQMAKAGELAPEASAFAKAGRFFPQMVEKMTATLSRLKYARPASRFVSSAAKFGEAVSDNYRRTFFAVHPELEGQVVVHHAVEQNVLRNYPGVVTDGEIHSLENLRGIPKELDALVHKSDIAKEWNEFYRTNPAGTITKQKLLDKATEIDRKFGYLFKPALE